jgi:glycolate oxidase
MRRPLPPRFLSRLERAVGEAFVDTSAAGLEEASHDETPNLPPALPDVVVRPGCTDEVAAVVRACADAGVYLTPRGAGTGKAGGCVPIYGGVVLAMDRLGSILHLSPPDLTVRAQPGVVLGELQAAVEEQALFYPPDPASLAWCTLGGNVATNAGGPRALRYGTTRDYVLGLEAVLPTGEVVRTGRQTVKGVAGYDITSLLTGSEGTLAVITEVTLKLLPRPRAVSTALAVFPTSEAAAECVSRVLAAGIVPRTLEYIDRVSLLALKALGTAPFPLPLHAGAALIVETDGESEASSFAALERALEEACAAGATSTLVATDENKRREVWAARRLLSEATRRFKSKKISEDVVVPRSRIPELVARWSALGEERGMLTCAYGHAGDGNLHAQVLYEEDEELPKVHALLDALFALTLQLGGTISGEHGIGLAKRRWLPQEQGEALISLQQRIKDAFDPAGILNPGKLLPERVALRAAALAAS